MIRVRPRHVRRLSPARWVAAGLFLLASVLLGVVPRLAGAAGPSVAFYYGPSPLPPELRVFDFLVVEPANVIDRRWVAANRDRLFAYVSIGEVTPGRSYHAKIPGEWLRADNRQWQSRVIDPSAPGWPRFFVDEIIAPLHEQGYRNFFLDNVDSYHLLAATAEARQPLERGLIEAIRLVKARYPEAKLMLNRGFEILPQIRDLVFAVAAESLFQSWDNGKRQYVPVSAEDRQWLVSQLARVRDEHRLPVVVIDYVPPSDRALARDVAARIRALGFVPWVTDGEVDAVGIGAVEPLPRRVLLVFDSKIEGAVQRLSLIHQYAAMPLNYLGYVVEYLDVAREVLPDLPLAGRYAGIVTWFQSAQTSQGGDYGKWLLRQLADGVPIAVLGQFGVELSDQVQAKFGLKVRSTPPKAARQTIRVVSRKPSAAFEIEPMPSADGFFPLSAGHAADVWLRTTDGGAEQDAVAITSWGGYALAPFTVSRLFDSGNARWVIDPMAFFTRALKLPELPVPDVTTENGRRLLMVHIDGDGFANKSELALGHGRWAAEVLYDEILRRYAIPHTVSVIEGEVAPHGRYPEFSAELEPIARRIFALPHVEAASHSFSHPFRWERMADGRPDEYSLGIPGYIFDEAREVEGSVAYVERLLPPGKRCEVFLWSGNCMPGGSVLKRAWEAGLLNMNGGETIITRNNPSLTAVGPLGITEGGYLQVFAPNQNENRYTNLWTGPFYGFERVIETFELTERPLRLKPVNIYYHTYSASKTSSLKALKKVYDWALRQPVLPVHASAYIRKVVDFHELAIARDGDGWRISGGSEVRTLRVSKHMGYPDLARSEGVLGWWDEEEVRYVHLDGRPVGRLVLRDTPSVQPRLARANARVRAVPGGWRFEGHQPLELELADADRCKVRLDGKAVARHPVTRGRAVFRHAAKAATLEMDCGR